MKYLLLPKIRIELGMESGLAALVTGSTAPYVHFLLDTIF